MTADLHTTLTELAARATPGPHSVRIIRGAYDDSWPKGVYVFAPDETDPDEDEVPLAEDYRTEADAALHVALRNALPELLEALADAERWRAAKEYAERTKLMGAAMTIDHAEQRVADMARARAAEGGGDGE